MQSVVANSCVTARLGNSRPHAFAHVLQFSRVTLLLQLQYPVERTQQMVSTLLMCLVLVQVTNSGNVILSPSRYALPSSCPKSYHFRCEVTNSVRLFWKVNGEQKVRLSRNSETNVFISEDSLNIYVQKIIPETEQFHASYVSTLWFDSSIFDDSINVTCESKEEGDTVVVEKKDPECTEHSHSSGNARITYSSPESASSFVLVISPGTFYQFRCEVINSERQFWKVSDNVMFRLSPNSNAPSFSQEEPFYTFTQDVVNDGSNFDANFTSYFWFNLERGVCSSVSCESATENITLMLEAKDEPCQELKERQDTTDRKSVV